MTKGLPVLLLFLALLAFVLMVKFVMSRKWWGEGQKPEKSLVLVVRNQQEMIEGILRRAVQTRNAGDAGTELVVIDNGSWDETPRIIARLARTPGGFTFIKMDSYKKLNQVVELGLEICRGEKICYLGLKEKMALHDIYNVFNEVMVKNPSGYFMPRQYFVELQRRNRTRVPEENKTWGS